MAEEYPDLLPPFLIDSYGYDEENDLIRTDMEAGPARVRRRSTKSGTVFTVSSKMTHDQLKIFESWFRHKINGGVEWFNVVLDTGSGLVEHMGRYVGKCSVRHGGALTWLVAGKIEVEELMVMSEEDLDRIIDPSSFPSIVSATIGPSGRDLTLVFSEAMTQRDYYDSDFTLSVSNRSGVSISYTSGDGTSTYIYAINVIVTPNTTVTLSYSGRTDGIEDGDGNDLGAVVDFGVINDSVDDLLDLVLWGSCEGSKINANTYTATPTDYPPEHTASTTDLFTVGTAHYRVGTKGLYYTTLDSQPYNIFSFDPLSGNKGRVGVWVKMIQYGVDMALFALASSSSSDYVFLFSTHDSINTIVKIELEYANITRFISDFSIGDESIADVWHFYELSWDFGSGEIFVYVDGVKRLEQFYQGTNEYYFDRWYMGTHPKEVSNIKNAYDNYMISSEPGRDLYALALLESCPRV